MSSLTEERRESTGWDTVITVINKQVGKVKHKKLRNLEMKRTGL
jgi:hypothetical protein